MLPSFARETLQVLRAGTVSDHGTTRNDWSAQTSRDVRGCSFQPAIGSDDNVYRQAVGGVAQAFMPPGTDITGQDRVGRKGKVYEVLGEPQEWTGPTPRTANLVVNLHIWEG